MGVFDILKMKTQLEISKERALCLGGLTLADDKTYSIPQGMNKVNIKATPFLPTFPRLSFSPPTMTPQPLPT